MEDYYKILGVSREASKEEIKKAYRNLAHKHHPDKGGDEKTFKKISEAYHVLADEKKREQYDRFGKSGPSASGFGGGFSQQDFDMSDIFEDLFGFSRGRRRKSKKGEDISVRIETSLEKILQNEEKTITIEKLVSCSSCKGKGYPEGTKTKNCGSCQGSGRVRTAIGPFAQVSTCPSCQGEGSIPEKVCDKCKGEGRVKDRKSIKITIPAGIETGQTLRIQGQGNDGRKGNPAGDLLVEVIVKNNTSFKREGNDLHYKAQISISQAILGDKIEVKLLDGKKISLKVPQGTSSGKVFRVSGKGVPRLSGYGQGDLYITVNIKIPQKLTKEQKKLFEQLKKEGI